MMFTTSGSTGKRTLVLSGRTVLYCGTGITVVTLGRVVCNTAGGGNGITSCSCGRQVLGLGVHKVRDRCSNNS